MIVAIDIGGTKTLIAIYNENGEIIRSDKHKTETDFDDFTKQLCLEVKKLAGNDSIDGIGIAAPALIDFETGIAKSFGNLGWKDVNIVAPLKEEFTDRVLIDNDANMGALGEANMGAGKDYNVNLYVTLSTGIGTGITRGGYIEPALRNSEGGMMQFMHNGELTRWETFASGKAFVAQYDQYGSDDDNPEHWKEWAQNVALGMSNLNSIIQPDVIVIGGSMGNHIKKYHEFLQTNMQEMREPTVDMPILVGAKDPDNAVINGCFIACKQSNQG